MHRPNQIATINGMNLPLFEALPEPVCLHLTTFVEWNLGMTIDQALRIVGCFAVADEQ
jgi:hypothetical protein